MSIVVVTPPSQPLMSLDDVKARLQINLPDVLLQDLIDTAIARIDAPRGGVGCAFSVQTFEYRVKRREIEKLHWSYGWSGMQAVSRSGTGPALELPFPPLKSIVSVHYTDWNGVDQTLDPTTYVAVGGVNDVASLMMATPYILWPRIQLRDEALRVQFVAGYDAVPVQIRQAILLLVRKMTSTVGRDPLLQVDTVYGVGSQTFASGAQAGAAFDVEVEALLSEFRPPSISI